MAEVDPHNSCAQFVAFSGRIFLPGSSEVDPHNSCAQFVAVSGRIFLPGTSVTGRDLSSMAPGRRLIYPVCNGPCDEAIKEFNSRTKPGRVRFGSKFSLAKLQAWSRFIWPKVFLILATV